MPRSPIFLVSKGDLEGARKSLQFFRGKSRDVTDELEQIKAEHAESQKIGSVGFFEVTFVYSTNGLNLMCVCSRFGRRRNT